ncbi:MAG: hypothetical protein HOA57_00550 [Candidatus Magasanikbacteria bacterium]|jgi:hypothetical protein|nr:hypothetical protein [Candidatus Magasanikbacteria bacterium]MBT4315328.1 hypothetical protein [Candidatus Magasanikbacteria bacterium]MBT4547200.1 hypothetical protein [Candidatus Magasanikbacteria bacterium]MBT6818864.1 hypothetical protein [Candidatus Magasanikbacteria bacterium]
MLSKVLKNLKKEEKKLGKGTKLPSMSLPKKKQSSLQGFHAKASSQAGAQRQRSIGNRMWKTNTKPK